MELKTYFARDFEGNIIEYPQVTVYEAGGLTLATGLQDQSGASLSNPFTGAASGKVAFAAPDGEYDIQMVGGSLTGTMRVQFFDANHANSLVMKSANFAVRPKFFDSFKRADTSPGSIGAGWSVKGVYAGSYPLPAGTDGKITSMGVECPGGLTTYFQRTLTNTPEYMQAKVSWKDLSNGQTGYQTFAMICTASNNLIDDMGLHLTLTHTTLRVQERIAGGAFVDIMPVVDIQPRLSLLDGENTITLEIDAESNAGTVHLNERSYSFSSPNLAAHIGPVVAIEFAQTGSNSNRWRGRILEFSAS